MNALAKQHPSEEGTTQAERLLSHLNQHGEIDPLSAWTQLGIYRLSARILDLRIAGHDIVMTRKQVKNRFHEDCSVASYRLMKKGGAA